MSQSLASSTANAARDSAAARARRAARPVLRRPSLRVVQAPPTAGSPLAFAVICALVLGSGLITLLLLNTAVAQDSFGLQSLKASSQQLADRRQDLAQSIALSQSPQQLSAKAYSLGLVPAAATAFVRLPSGKVMGVADPAPAAAPPTVFWGSAGGAGTGTAPGTGAGPAGAPAIRVDRTAHAGAAPPAAPAAPATTGTTSTTPGSPAGTKTAKTTTTPTPTPTR